MTAKHTGPRLVGLVAGAAMLLAGCGGGDATLTTAARATPTPVAAQDAQATGPTPATGTVKVVPKASSPAKPAPKRSTSVPKPKATSKPVPARKPPPGVNLEPLRSGAGTSYTATVNHRPGEEFGTGTVRLWLPDKVSAVRGIIVGGFFPGDAAADPRPDGDLMQLALKYHLAVVTHTYTHL